MLWSAGVCKTIAELKCVKTVFSLYKNRGSVLTEQVYLSPLVEGEDQILFTTSWATRVELVSTRETHILGQDISY